MNFLRNLTRTTSLFLILLALVFFIPCAGEAQTRTEIKIPNIPGYITLKCDFHIHTVFSDGYVWPTVRADEAWREGLDALAISDHIERYHREEVLLDHNRSFELALPAAERLNLIIIRGAEITRDMPPGHINAIFLNDVDPLVQESYMDAIQAAISQEAFVFLNHPSWYYDDEKSAMRPEHAELYEKGWLHGVEVVNGRDYYPFAHRWCLEKNLTMMGNSDVHDPINFEYDLCKGEHRPITLVFATESSLESIKEALFARRTAVLWEDKLIGEAKYLKPIFDNSVVILNPNVSVKGRSRAYIQIHNHSDIPFELALEGELEDISAPERITLQADKTVLFTVRGKSEVPSGVKDISIHYTVKNLWIAPEEGLPVELKIKVTFVPAEN